MTQVAQLCKVAKVGCIVTRDINIVNLLRNSETITLVAKKLVKDPSMQAPRAHRWHSVRNGILPFVEFFQHPMQAALSFG